MKKFKITLFILFFLLSILYIFNLLFVTTTSYKTDYRHIGASVDANILVLGIQEDGINNQKDFDNYISKLSFDKDILLNNSFEVWQKVSKGHSYDKFLLFKKISIKSEYSYVGVIFIEGNFMQIPFKKLPEKYFKVKYSDILNNQKKDFY